MPDFQAEFFGEAGEGGELVEVVGHGEMLFERREVFDCI